MTACYPIQTGSVKHGDLNRFGLQSGSDFKCLLRVIEVSRNGPRVYPLCLISPLVILLKSFARIC
jgi:hypothetical protein